MYRRLFPVATALAIAFVAHLTPAAVAASPSHPTPVLTRWEPQTKIASGKKSKTWTSPWVAAKGTTALNPSWNVSTMPNGSFLTIQMRVKDAKKTTGWKTVAEWRYGLSGGKRTTKSKQSDSLAWVDTDTVKAKSGKKFSAWQIRVNVQRKNTKVKSPVLTGVAVVSSTYTSKTSPVSKTTMTRDAELAVPTYSQMVHIGHSPQYGGGGQAWCSPTSTSMVLRYYGLGPSAKSYTWAKGADGFVDHAARYTYDSAYRGTGTWPFNTAYASRYGTDAVVHRLPDLRSVERFISAGVPVIVSVAFKKGELTGAPIGSTPGHLIVVRGFTATGEVIVNDPAGKTNAQVRRIYNRAQFERAWLKGSGGISYVIAPAGMNLAF
mgnify:CR=1 FL=1